jgi:hypothetical protein
MRSLSLKSWKRQRLKMRQPSWHIRKTLSGDRLRGWGERIRTSMCKVKFISLKVQQSSDLPVPAQTIPSSQRNNFLFQVYQRRRCHDLLRAASVHRSSNPVTEAYRIRTAVSLFPISIFEIRRAVWNRAAAWLRQLDHMAGTRSPAGKYS